MTDTLAGEPGDTSGSPPRPDPPAAFEPAPAAVPATPAAFATRTGSWFSGLDPRGWRTTLVVAAIMIGTVIGANIVNAAVPLPADPSSAAGPGPGVPGATPLPGDPAPPDRGPVSPGTPVDVGSGVALYPPNGWTVTASEQGQVVLQKGGVTLVATAGAYDGTPAELAAAYSESFFAANGQFSAGEPQSAEIGGSIPAVAFAYAGVAEGNLVDGVMAVGVAEGTGVVLNAFAPAGQLEPAIADIDAIATTLQLTPGDGG
jgi:hypothetical protein